MRDLGRTAAPVLAAIALTVALAATATGAVSVLVISAAFALIGFSAITSGHDSRDGRDWNEGGQA